MLWSIVQMMFKHPTLVQACLIGCLNSSTFTSYWTTLTFLLSFPPYNYNSLVIGLFAFIGIGAMTLGPPYSKLIIDRYVPLLSVILGGLMALIGICIGTYTGTFTVAGPIIQAFLLDLGLQTSQIDNRTSIYSIEPKARNRINTAYMVCSFLGQLMGTAAGKHIYARGGWIASGSASVGFISLGLLIALARGPHEERWVGWSGGWHIRKLDNGRVKSEPALEEVRGELSAKESKDNGTSAKRIGDEEVKKKKKEEDSTATPDASHETKRKEEHVSSDVNPKERRESVTLPPSAGFY